MTAKAPRRPRDANQLAKSIVDDATGQSIPNASTSEKDPAAVSLGRRGGLKGGKARAEKLSADERQRIARRAAEARWKSDE